MGEGGANGLLRLKIAVGEGQQDTVRQRRDGIHQQHGDQLVQSVGFGQGVQQLLVGTDNGAAGIPHYAAQEPQGRQASPHKGEDHEHFC